MGGTERHLLQVLPRLRHEGLRPVVYTLTHRGELANAMEQAGIPVMTFPGSVRLRSLPKGWRTPIVLILTALRLWFIMIKLRPALVHFFLPTAYLVGAPVAMAAFCRRLLMSRRSRNHYQLRHPVLTRVEHWLHRHMEIVIGNSRAVMADLVREGIPEKRLRLLYNGIQVTQRGTSSDGAGVRREFGISEQAIVFILVANLIPYKGHADLIMALGMIRRQLPSDWVLLCVGHDHGIKADLVQQAEDLGIADRVRFLGQRRDVERLLPMADIGLLVSHEEGFSNSVLEKMAAGLPMVVTDVGGNAEIVEHGICGYVVPPHAPDALGAAIIRLVYNSSRINMGLAAQARVWRDFSLDRCVDAYMIIYRKIMYPHLYEF
ncbi:MAG: glycosyltransferase [Thermodesulfobacteriota bacterium]